MEESIKPLLSEEDLKQFMEKDKYGDKEVFLSDGKVYLCLSFRDSHKLMWVMGAVGSGVKWMWELQKLGLSNGYEYIGFKVKKDLPWGKSLVKFTKARLIESTPTGDEYYYSLRAR